MLIKTIANRKYFINPSNKAIKYKYKKGVFLMVKMGKLFICG